MDGLTSRHYGEPVSFSVLLNQVKRSAQNARTFNKSKLRSIELDGRCTWPSQAGYKFSIPFLLPNKNSMYAVNYHLL